MNRPLSQRRASRLESEGDMKLVVGAMAELDRIKGFGMLHEQVRDTRQTLCASAQSRACLQWCEQPSADDPAGSVLAVLIAHADGRLTRLPIDRQAAVNLLCQIGRALA